MTVHDTTIHVISAASTPAGQWLAMCGAELGTYGQARTYHIVGNYAGVYTVRQYVSCETCKASALENLARYGHRVD